MESRTLTLDDLTNLFDDVEPAEHDDSANNSPVPNIAPIPSGKYGVMLTSLDVDRDQTGAVRNKKRFTLDVKVVDAPATAAFAQDRLIRFLRVTGESYKRKGKDGGEVSYVELFDLVHAFDRTFNCNNSLDTATRFLLEQMQSNAVGYLQLDWKAWDTKYWQACNGDSMESGSDEQKALRKACSIKGMKRFGPDGTMVNEISGNLLKAQVYMKWAYPSKA